MSRRKSNIACVTEWCCGVFHATQHRETKEVTAIPKFIYKIDYQTKTCYWATIDELYKYGVEPIVQKMNDWDDTFTGLTFHGSLCFFVPKFDLPKTDNPLPLDESGIIPDPEEDEE